MMVKTLWFVFIALLVGCLFPLQGALNAQLGKVVSHPLHATLISFIGGVIMLLILLIILQHGLPSIEQIKSTHWLNLTGGVYGVIIISSVILLTPRIGITNTIAAMVVGQLVFSVVLDHFGIFGLQERPINSVRLLGCFGLVLSLLLIQKS